MEKYHIHGAHILDPANQLDEPMDMLIADGKMAALGSDFSQVDACVIEAAGLVCAPGLVDIHVHLRDPGQTHKEDIYTGCEAAAAGGVTSLACMPNTHPVCDTPAIVEAILAKAATAKARVYPVAAITSSLGGETLTDFAALKQAGAVALSDDGRPVTSADLMEKAMRQAAMCGLPIVSHCEELSLVRGGILHEGEVSRALNLPGIHRGAEEIATAREIALAAATGYPVHICHVSTKGSVALIRDAKRRGVPVTGETAPHYFSLTHACLTTRDADFRMNPPLRTEEDVRAVIEGLADGTLTVIATDHAPHTAEEKADFVKAPNGVVGLETSLSAGITYLVKPGFLTLAQLIACMSLHPARLLGLPGGTLCVGAPADVVLFDPQAAWTVCPEKLHSKSHNTPYKGKTLSGRVCRTFLGGMETWRLTD